MIINNVQAFTFKGYSPKNKQYSPKISDNTPVMAPLQTPKGIYSGQVVSFAGKVIGFPSKTITEQKLREIITEGKAGSTEDFVNEIIDRHFMDEEGNYNPAQAEKFVEIRNKVKAILEKDNESLHAELDPLLTSDEGNITAFDPARSMNKALINYLNANSGADVAKVAENIEDGQVKKDFARMTLAASDETLPFEASHFADLVLYACKNFKTGEYVYENLDEKIAFIDKSKNANVEDLHEIIKASCDKDGIFNVKIAGILAELSKATGVIIEPEENRALLEEFCLKPDSTMDEKRLSFFMYMYRSFGAPPEEMRIYLNAAVNPITGELDSSSFDALSRLSDYLEYERPLEVSEDPKAFVTIAKELASTIETARDPKTGIFDEAKWEEKFQALPRE